MGAGGSHHMSAEQRERWRQERIKRREIRQRRKQAKQEEQAEKARLRLERGEPPDLPWWHLEWWRLHALRWPWQWWRDVPDRRAAQKSSAGHPARDYELLGVGNVDEAQTESTEEFIKPRGGMPHVEGELRRRK